MKYDYLVVGAGIIGLSIARELKKQFPKSSIAVIEKETDIAMHATGRNSGVLHAGFYYSADSLKARFTRDGNKALTDYCIQNHLKINRCKKLVVAKNAEEVPGLEELKRRGDKNGVELHWVSTEEMKSVDPNAKTYQKALLSPNTSSVDSIEVCQTIKDEITQQGVEIHLGHRFIRSQDNTAITNKASFSYDYLINAAGLYADKIAHGFGFGKEYVILPFKGLYLSYEKNKTDVKTCIYPVPNLLNPFLGTHFTTKVDGGIKIGPTSTPAFWREHYHGFSRFNPAESIPILFQEAILFFTNAFNFRRLAIQEMKKYSKKVFIKSALELVHEIDLNGFGHYLKPGIRAQLLHKKTHKLEMDFVLQGDQHTFHVLNAVSPAFTCAFPFAEHVVQEIKRKREH